MILNKKYDSILVYRLGSLGDTIIALPAFHAIKKAFPNFRITLLTNKPVASMAAPAEAIFAGSGLVDEVLDYPIGTRNPFVFGCLLWRLRARRFGAVFNLTEYRSDAATRRDFFFFCIAGAKRFYGFNLEARDKKPAPDFSTGEVEWEASRLVRRVASFSQVDLDDDKFWDLRLTNEEQREAELLLAKVSNHDQLIAFSIGTKVQSKDWGIANWRDLSHRLAADLMGWSVVFLGSAEEAEQSEACSSSWGQMGLNLCGKSSPRVSAAILSKCKLFIGHDSGPMHLAACVGTPCVAIFSARNLPRHWFPRGNKNVIIYKRTECAGCGLEVCTIEQKKCLTSISVKHVQDAVFSQLQTLGHCKLTA
jgi:ADP-heptose:LPS heptosyltransferase